MSQLEIGPFLKRYWWVILLAVAAAFGSAAFFTLARGPAYKATTTLVIGPNENLKAPREVVDSLNTLDRRSVVATFARIPSSRTVLERAQQQLQLPAGEVERYKVETVVIPDTNIIEVSVEGPAPALAAGLANAVADQTKDYVREFYDIYGMKVLDRAGEPAASSRSNLLRGLAVGAVLGLTIGIGVSMLLEYLRRLRPERARRAETVVEAAAEPEAYDRRSEA